MSAASQSNVDCPSMYEGDDQQSFKRSEVDKLSRHSGDNVKGYMGSASRGRASIWGEAMILASPLAAESQASEVNRLLPLNGNRPAKGVIIDKELMEEEAAMLRKKENKHGMPGRK
ncbi:hypothetical protein B0T24DRAFT_684605 [Lasiosphaeria ovina]|uniref:Uncharacterized protein n=1 Tax=Lasiosphaeria ovina TaxID=92902 RepID=A0AAE0MYF0_9PEZI|nr:hypothetical protein B0T24DRAFT_684605 [Lasiosphaeria ovina]